MSDHINNHESTDNTPSFTSPTSTTPKLQNVFQYVDYIEIGFPVFVGATEKTEYLNKLVKALKHLPNLKGIMYYDGVGSSSNGLMAIYQKLLENKQMITHLNISYQSVSTINEREQIDGVVAKFFQKGGLSNLRVLNLDFHTFEFGDFNFGWFKELVAVHTIAIDASNVKSLAFSLMDVLGALPKSLRQLKLCVQQNYAIQVLEVLFRGAIAGFDDLYESDTLSKVTSIQQTFSCLMPNLEVLNLNNVVVLRRNGTSGFLDSAFTGLAWAMVTSFYNPQRLIASHPSQAQLPQDHFMRHLAEFHHHVVYINLHVDFESFNNPGHMLLAVLNAVEMLPLMRNLKSMLLGPFTSLAQQTLADLRLKVLERCGGEVTGLFLSYGIPTWNEIMDLWSSRQSEVGGSAHASGGILFPNLQLVTLLSLRKVSNLMAENEDEVKNSIFQFVDTLPETVIEIRDRCNSNYLAEDENEEEAKSSIYRFVDTLPCTVKEIRVGCRVTGPWNVTEVLKQAAGRRGIVVRFGKFLNPFEMYCYPVGLKDL
ncbi:hypothetical protein HDU76_007543 [Blyttiomyces sp. JEL0837]|nr:hypothetical protein HDU76_007543 [Blyttiomyces sp. JEL0837]